MTTDPESTSLATPKPVRRNRRRLGCVIVIMAVVMIALLVAGIGRSRWLSKPAYWTRNQKLMVSVEQTELIDTADRAFNRILSELSDSQGYKPTGKPDLGVRLIELRIDEANAWLATRLNDWLVNRQRKLPAGLSQPMITTDGGSLIAAFHYRNKEIDQVFGVRLSLNILETGQGVLSVDGIYGGRLWLPTGQVLKRLPILSQNGSKSQIVAVLLGEQPFDPILPIDGARRARILEMRVTERGVGLVVQAEPNGAPEE